MIEPDWIPDDGFDRSEVISAIESFLELGEKQHIEGLGSYFAGHGWAATVLRWHLNAVQGGQGS